MLPRPRGRNCPTSRRSPRRHRHPLDDRAYEFDSTLSSNVTFDVDLIDIGHGRREPYSLRAVILLDTTANIPLRLREPVRVADLDITASGAIDGPAGDVPGQFQFEVVPSSVPHWPQLESLAVGNIEASNWADSTPA